MNIQKSVDKLLSGRFFLTIITGLVFAYVSWKKIIGADVIATIITMVFSLYFTRGDRNVKPDTMDKPKDV